MSTSYKHIINADRLSYSSQMTIMINLHPLISMVIIIGQPFLMSMAIKLRSLIVLHYTLNRYFAVIII